MGESGEGRKGRRIEEVGEKEEEEGAGSPVVEEGWKGRKGRRAVFLPGTPVLQGNPHCGSGSFLLWECYQDLKGI